MFTRKLAAVACAVILAVTALGQNTMAQDVVTFRIVKYSHAGRFLAVVTNDNRFQILDVSTGQIVMNLSGFSGQITTVAWNPDDTRIAVGTVEKSSIWNYWSRLFSWVVYSGTLSASSDRLDGVVQGVIWSADSTTILAGTDKVDGGGTWAWGVSANNARKITGTSVGLEPSPNGKQIALAGLGGGIFILDASTFDYQKTPSSTTEAIPPAHIIAWHPDGQYIASGHLNGDIRIWDTFTGRVLQTLSGASSGDDTLSSGRAIRALKFEASGDQLQSFNAEGIIRVWDVGTWQQINEVTVGRPYYAADWSPDGTTLAYGVDTSSADGALTNPLRVVRLADLVQITPTPKP